MPTGALMTELDLPALPPLLLQNIDMFVCPVCNSALRVSHRGTTLECTLRRHSFKVEGGVPLMFLPNEWDAKADVTATVQSFYDAQPFPNYDDLDSENSLREKAERGVLARLLNDQIAPRSKVLEVGCGTGQLSNYLGLKWGRSVFGCDLSLNALRLASELKNKE